MSKSIRAVITRPNLETAWPFDLFTAVADLNFSSLEGAGVGTYIKGNEDADLEITVIHLFNDDVLFDEIKDLYIPMWRNDVNALEVNAYCATNNITYPLEIVTDPDLTGYVQITTDRRLLRPLL